MELADNCPDLWADGPYRLILKLFVDGKNCPQTRRLFVTRPNSLLRGKRRISADANASKSVDHDPDSGSTTSRQFDIVAVIGVGGAVGVLARYGIANAFPVASREIPWSTLAINLSGSFLLGMVLFVVEQRPPNRLLRPFLAIGVLGGFTTFSTFAVEVVQLVRDRPWIALSYLVISVGGGVFSVLVGGTVGRQLFARTGNRSPSSS